MNTRQIIQSQTQPTFSQPIYMKKYCLDLKVVSSSQLTDKHVLLKLSADTPLPDMLPGQFVQVKACGNGEPLLRRPISVNYVDHDNNELWLLIAAVGEGTRQICRLKTGESVNCLLPLGNNFSMPPISNADVLLVGGGVGVAPMLFQGIKLKAAGHHPHFLLGARTAADLLELDLFRTYGDTFITTEDGSEGEKGYVTNHSILVRDFHLVQTCGPKPMMQAVARYATSKAIPCEVSLENLMACGLGACLCCVEKTVKGNLCACTEGPVFNTNQLLW